MIKILTIAGLTETQAKLAPDILTEVEKHNKCYCTTLLLSNNGGTDSSVKGKGKLRDEGESLTWLGHEIRQFALKGRDGALSVC